MREEAIFRSADMTYVQLYIPLELSREIVCLLGNLGNVMFRDLNVDLSAFQRGYITQIRKFDDLERLINYMDEVTQKYSQETWKYTVHSDIDNSTQHPSLSLLMSTMQTHSLDTISDLASEITEFETRVRQLDDSLKNLHRRLNLLIEHRHTAYECQRYLEVNPGVSGRAAREQEGSRLSVDEFQLDSDEISETLSSTFSFDDGANGDSNLISLNAAPRAELTSAELEEGFRIRTTIIGSISRIKVETLNKILFRILRGNLFFHNIPITEPLLENDQPVEKDCFIVFTHGEVLLGKVRKVVESLNGTIFPTNEASSTVQNLNAQITDLQQICQTTEQTLYTELLIVSDQLPMWKAVARREKLIYASLNLFREESQGLVAEGWIPSSDLVAVSNALKNHSESIGSENSAVVSVIKTNRKPPTYHRTNKFTYSFQAIVDAYGVATYKEVNPGLATVVTFPFMFAIMFGDAGHGAILFMIALYLIFNEREFSRSQNGEIFDMAFSGRYVILLMGFFSIYTGLLYNDIFSLSMTFFKSGWEWPSDFKAGDAIEAVKSGVYPFGIDYAWHGTENNLIFTNSYKMKLSVLMGFIHMTYSLLFSLVNFRYFHSRVDIVGNFLPGLIFMQSIFGYLTWSIIYKWTKDWVKDEKVAPGLLNMLINMFLAPGVVDEPLFRGQAFLQVLFLLAALVCVPWLLLYKPLKLRAQNRNAISQGYQNIHEQTVTESILVSQENAGEDVVVTDYHEEHSGSFEFGDVMIHQVIHTIEFCLNSISHTASYLRLWALSLAHAQLSSVLWSMTIANSFSSKNPGSPLAVIKVVFLFGMWFVLTVCILVLMEGTSAMLHSLRLHWVEAMSKFFEGEGYPYEPFTFQHVDQVEP
ncbi:LANO_0E13564g1_1 [Lachancea nothofagi CBS 11611]|uniref:V-type proton ATPase subunit a n=1 Tax=Lachancea nothofagi CBS 11611 TaxID=1266666 RepID=A0A1G4JZ41_9SACH|nr:LANO_0E13564g1_1 [Lachancea nothofagi CBS 11611]